MTTTTNNLTELKSPIYGLPITDLPSATQSEIDGGISLPVMLIPQIRELLAGLGAQLNERKFYGQHYMK